MLQDKVFWNARISVRMIFFMEEPKHSILNTVGGRWGEHHYEWSHMITFGSLPSTLKACCVWLNVKDIDPWLLFSAPPLYLPSRMSQRAKNIIPRSLKTQNVYTKKDLFTYDSAHNFRVWNIKNRNKHRRRTRLLLRRASHTIELVRNALVNLIARSRRRRRKVTKRNTTNMRREAEWET